MRAWLIAAVALSASCSGSRGGAPPAEQKSNLLRGDRETSAALRSSSARPRPEELEQHPLEGDRLAIDEARSREQRAHREGHAEASLALEDFSHPACAALTREERRACPLSSVRWSGLREVEGGVEIDTREKIDPARLRWRFLCHMAFEKSRGKGSCPLGGADLAVSVIRLADRTTVRLVTEDRSGAGALQRQLKRLISTR